LVYNEEIISSAEDTISFPFNAAFNVARPPAANLVFFKYCNADPPAW